EGPDQAAQPYLFTTQIEAQEEADYAAQLKAWNYSFIGDYEQVLKTWDQGAAEKVDTLSTADSLAFRKKFSAEKAIPYILQRAEDAQVLIINEAHHIPMHRVFTTRLLEGLYERGYRYFGLEALSSGAISDSMLNAAQYPTLQTGFYTKEPQFGNLIREALHQGFGLFSYEATGGANGREREIEQAQQIADFMAQHPGEKILIHCGFAHAAEGEYKSWGRTMAGRLQEFTGIDPLTVNQTTYTERSERRFEDAYYRALYPKEPTIYVDAKNKAFQPGGTTYYYDLYVFHPRTRQLERPEWLLFADRKVMEVDLRHAQLSLPYKLLVYAEGEPIGEAVPLEVLEIKQNQSPVTCILPPGNHN
ncbi:MAG: hypothetical protein KDC44_25140, partial [Phaeodactylibacter sp.]|nr:hypothetical protein [Phaeodactylibacter sp.]